MLPLTSASTALAGATERLQAASIVGAALDAAVLLAHALGCSREQLLMAPERFPLSHGAAADFEAMLTKRLARMPVAQIIGNKEFWSLEFEVTSTVLTPRTDSETIIEAVLRHFQRGASYRILDLGTGSGALLLTLLYEYPDSTGLGVDKSLEALAVARRNATKLDLAQRASFMFSDWCAAIPNQEPGFDIVVANPPYIALNELVGLEPEVRDYEPSMALTDGSDGLSHYRAIASQIGAYMAPGSTIFLEIGVGQHEHVQQIFTTAGFIYAAEYHDLAGIPRCLVFFARKQFNASYFS